MLSCLAPVDRGDDHPRDVIARDSVSTRPYRASTSVTDQQLWKSNTLKILLRLSAEYLRFDHNDIEERCEWRYQRLDIVQLRPPNILQPFFIFATLLNAARCVLVSHLRLGQQLRVSINYIN